MLLRNFKMVRLFSGNIPLEIGELSRQHAIQCATFSITGAFLSSTIGSYDQNQQVYISSTENMPFDILSCVGTVSLKEGRSFIVAHIILSNQFGHVIGGRLF